MPIPFPLVAVIAVLTQRCSCGALRLSAQPWVCCVWIQARSAPCT